MKTKLLLFGFVLCFFNTFSQSTMWQKKSVKSTSAIKTLHRNLPDKKLFSLKAQELRQMLSNAPKRQANFNNSDLIVSFPNSQGDLERFRVYEASVMHPDLQAKYPEIRSYAAQGIDDPTALMRFSISPYGFNAMVIALDKPTYFIEPYTKNLDTYVVFSRAEKFNTKDPFECSVANKVTKIMGGNNFTQRNADDSILRTYRLAVSTTGEYTQYHGGTKAQALAAINTTMTRVNGIFEVDFNVNMVLVPNTDDVIYTNAGSDPYGSSGQWNGQLQSTLTSNIGEANYDVGHLFAQGQNNGNAGCIGCVCVNNQKGRGWTNGSIPEGDTFDVDYVAHELGHQFGANHTWTFGGNEGTNVQVEPGSGTTIMSYAGITGANTDVEQNVTPNFHAVSIEQVTDYIKTTSCQTNTNTGNSVPTVNAGPNYTIPRGTAFILEGSASDPDNGDVLSYVWEQMDENNASTTIPSVNATSGVAFRAYAPTSDSFRYFPRLETIKTGATSWKWEAVPNVSRNLNFRLTVRDNRVGGGTNNSDDMVVSVNASAGPFVVNSPNTNVTWNAGTTQTVTWNVAGTTGNGINAANVDIFLSTDGGDTYPIALASGVPNDGSHDIIVPNNQGNQNRIMVRGSNNIFFDISNSNFTIAGQVVCNADVPTGLAASNLATTTATLSWDAVPGATYDLRYREVGTSTWTTVAVTGISTNLTGLTALTDYEAQVRSKCNGGSNSAYSSSVNFTTTDVQLNYCNSASTNVNDEYISRVQLNTIDNTSGAQFYSDFTGISTTLTKDSQYTITITPTWTGTVYNEAYGVWIDYNRDGDFTDAGEQVFTQGNTQATSVSGSFTVPSSAVENSTRMRVTMRYNQVPGPCDNFTYGEVEDYTIIIEGSGPDIEAPVITLNGDSTINLNVGETYIELGATALDNEDGDITGDIVIGGDTVNTAIAGTYTVTYNVSDAAGNAATEVTRTVNVIADTTAPVITLIGNANINLELGQTYNEQGATATDNVDGNISSDIVIGGDTVNTAIAGTYIVTYNVSDAAGNAADEVTRTVTVNPDTTAPVITLNGASTINLNVGDIYTELGATATDNVDGNLTSSIVISGSVNTNIAGTYLVNYNVSDSSGNAATQVTRTVNVNADAVAPVITLNGAATVNLTVGDTYTELGATASDNIDGDISGDIVIGGDTVNTNVAGTYVVTYNVSDSAGNAAAQVTRTVNVNEASSGCAGGVSSFPYSESFESGDGWTQAGGDDGNWVRNSGVTPSNTTGPSAAVDGSFYMFLEASTNNSPGQIGPNATAILLSPCFDLTNETDAIFSFQNHMLGANIGTLSLEVSTDDGGSWTSLWSLSGEQGNQWNPVSVDLATYVGQAITLRFVGTTGSSWRSDIAIDDLELTTDGGSTGGCDTLNFNDYTLNSFSTQDSDGANSIGNGGASLTLTNNTWKYIDFPYTVTANTVIELEFSSTSEGEIHAIGFENNNSLTSSFYFKFYGTQNYGITNFDNYTSGTTTYVIPVGDSYTGTMDRLVFINDNDAGSGNNSTFSNVKVYETSCSSSKAKVVFGTRSDILGNEDEFDANAFTIYPNPTKDILHVKSNFNAENITGFKVVNMLGQTMMQGENVVEINVKALEEGVYFLELSSGNQVISKRFIKQ